MTTFNVAKFLNSYDPLVAAAIVNGEVPGVSIVHKFGQSDTIGTSYVPVAQGNVYPTPQVAGGVNLRVKAGGHADDTAAGDGAREVTFQDLDTSGNLVTEAVATAGADASSATSTTFLRFFRAWVSASGTYATSATGSHTAAITIEDSGGVGNWGIISATGFPHGQSQIGFYSIPLGKTGYILNESISLDSQKLVDIILFKRENILQTTPPYSAMRAVAQWVGLAETPPPAPLTTPRGPYPALTDIGFMAKVGATTGSVEVNFEILLIDEAE